MAAKLSAGEAVKVATTMEAAVAATAAVETVLAQETVITKQMSNECLRTIVAQNGNGAGIVTNVTIVIVVLPLRHVIFIIAIIIIIIVVITNTTSVILTTLAAVRREMSGWRGKLRRVSGKRAKKASRKAWRKTRVQRTSITFSIKNLTMANQKIKI